MNIDIYVFVDTRGKNSKDLLTLSIAISKGNGNFVTADSNPDIYRNVKNFLIDFNRYLFEYDVKSQITAENLKIQNLLKDIGKLTGEATKLRKNIAETEAKIQKKEQDAETKQAQIEQGKINIEELNRKL
jgi:peptidoglycan hydrolase CwlO-like protein